jgi:type I restriction enzyme S subunit
VTDSGVGDSVALAPGGRLPEGWVRARIGDLCDVNPRAFDEEPEDDDLISQVPMAFVEAESGRMDASTQVRFGDFKKKSLTRFQENDVLFAKITPCMENGKIAKAQGLIGGRALGST